MQTASSKIWTQKADSISYKDNCCFMCNKYVTLDLALVSNLITAKGNLTYTSYPVERGTLTVFIFSVSGAFMFHYFLTS